MKTKKKNFLDLDPGDINKLLTSMGHGAYRTGQILKWVYLEKGRDFEGCSVLPAKLRKELDEKFTLRSLALESKEVSKKDGTIKFSFLTKDSNRISSVFLPYEDRNSACISSQAGCETGCAFCATGAMGFKRDLTRGEILEQILQMEQETGARISGILMMGMGEPLANFDNTVSALKTMMDSEILGLGRRHITVSTVGHVPLIVKFAAANTGVRLALSLHAGDDRTRDKLVPFKKVPYSVDEIMKACLHYCRTANSRFTIEYVLVRGVNDSKKDAENLYNLIETHRMKGDMIQVNLIPYNKIENRRYLTSEHDTAENFKEYLMKKNIITVIRMPRGADIGAACGQLGV